MGYFLEVTLLYSRRQYCLLRPAATFTLLWSSAPVPADAAHCLAVGLIFMVSSLFFWSIQGK